jgi:hypothetical protein
MRYVRAAVLLAVLGSYISFAGCNGGSGGATPPVTAPDQQQPGITAPSDTTSNNTTNSDATTSSTSTLSTTSTTSAPRHVMNSVILWGYGGVPTSVSLSKVAPWLSWAMTGSQYAATIRSAGIKVIPYVNFWRNHKTDNPIIGYTDLKPGGAHAAAEAKTCGGSVIYDPIYGGGYAADARKTSSAIGHAKVLIYYREQQFGRNWDAMLADQVGTFLQMTPPCNYSPATYPSAVNTVHSYLGIHMWVNALGKKLDPYIGQVTNPSNVVGGMCEGCYGQNFSGTDKLDTSYDGIWQWVENTEISTIAKHKIFWDYARISGYAQYELGFRKYVYASFLLGYSPSYAMLQTALKTYSGFPVMPETGLVPLNPLTTASNVSGYRSSTGAYVRQFGACYYRGTYHSKCAVAVNPNASSVYLPSTIRGAYYHSLVLVGSGVLDGGYVKFTGGHVTSLPAQTGAILFP